VTALILQRPFSMISRTRPMQLTERQSEGLLRVYEVVVPAADLEKRLAAKIEEVRPRVKINGFRPGKVPASHIRKVYGPSMMQDIVNETVQSSTQASLDKAKVRPASEPSLQLKSDITKVIAGKEDLTFELSLEVMPEFEATDLKNIAITRPVAAVSDEQVDEAAAELAKSQVSYDDKDGAAAEGDAVVLDFLGKIDGEAFAGGAAEDATVVIGDKRFIPGFEEQLVGVKAGDEKVLEVSFPDEYPVPSLAGKAAQFETKIKQVRSPREAKADDDLAKQMGFEGLANLKEALRQRLEADHGQQSRAKAKRSLFDKLDAAHDFGLPPRMVDAEFAQIWRQIQQDKEAGRLDPTDADKSDDDLKGEYRKIAERRVRLGLVLAKIGQDKKIEVSDQEVSQAIAQQARNFPGREQQVFDAYRKNPNMLASVRAPIYEEKVVDYILELAKVTNQDVTREALFADEDEAPAPAEVAEKPAKKKKAKASADAAPDVE
jgi:trigger factor